MSGQYPNLSWALINNPYLKNIIFEEYKNKSHSLSNLENLISELRSYKCEGIQEKINDVSTLNRFLSTLSELEFVRIIAKTKKVNRLKLLPDDYLSGKSPDILYQDEKFTSYVEVTRINDNPHITDRILSHLREFLKHHPYRVDVSLKTELSIPMMKREERYVQKDLVEKSLVMFDESFQENISNNTSQIPSFKIDTDGLIFTIKKTDSGMGYPGIIAWDLIEIPTNILCDYIKGRLIEKAIKRDSFENEHRKPHYIIALDCHEPSIDAIDMNELLYGRTSHLAPNIMGLPEEDYIKWKSNTWDSINNEIRDNASWIIIEQAKNRGWEALLIKRCLIPNDYAYVEKEGIFLSERKMKNVSGVLFRDNWNKVTFHPNPFCDTEINDPNILNLN